MSLLFDREHRKVAERELELSVRAASAAVNLKLAGEIATLEAIAEAIDIAEVVDSAGLREARRVINAQPDWLGLRLIEPESGQTVVHLGVGLGGQPDESTREGAPTDTAGIGRLSGLKGSESVPYISLQVPVLRDGSIKYLLAAFVSAASFDDVFNQQALPYGWIGGVIDGEDRLVGHSPNTPGLHDPVGAAAVEAVVARVARTPRVRVFIGHLDKKPTYFAVRRSHLSGWLTFIAAPAEAIVAQLHFNRAIMFGAGTVAVLLTLFLAETLIHSAMRLSEEKAAVRRKDLLLREINHRIKNNLQVIASLINLQTDRASVAQARRQFEAIGSRVKALSLVHELLDRRFGEGEIDLASYLDQICIHVQSLYGWAARNVRLVLDLQPFTVRTDTAVAIGLILNESLTNSLKHAFPHTGGGMINIRVRCDGVDSASFELADDGIGLPPEADRVEGVGLGLIGMLVDQTGGEVSWGVDGGTSLRVRFPLFPANEASSLAKS